MTVRCLTFINSNFFQINSSNALKQSKFFSSYLSNMSITLNDIKELNGKHVHIKNQDELMKKINVLIKDGSKNLQIVSDFDMTLTKQHENGKKHVSSFGMIRSCPSIPESYIEDELKLLNKYRPIEIDPYMPREEKIKHMIDWWKESEKLLIGITLPPNEIAEAARKYEQNLRDGTANLLNDLNKVHVPVLVFSAGVGDVVTAVLKHHQVLFSNVKVISNFFEFDENHKILGYKNDIIHVLNKNEQVLTGTEYHDLVENRNNVILMGDHLGDAGMAEGIPNKNAELKIGFLYEKVEESLNDYMEAFDIVLVDDQTMNVIQALLKLILKNEP